MQLRSFDSHIQPDQDRALLDDLARVMRDASICGLGQTAPAAVQSAISLQLLNGRPSR